MSHSVNKATLLGRLGQDPEVRETKHRKKIAHFSIATHDRWRDQVSGDMREHTEWHRVAIFNENLVRIAAAHLEGQIQTRQWDDAGGKPRITTEIVLTGYQAQLTLLDSRKPGADRGGSVMIHLQLPMAKPALELTSKTADDLIAYAEGQTWIRKRKNVWIDGCSTTQIASWRMNISTSRTISRH